MKELWYYCVSHWVYVTLRVFDFCWLRKCIYTESFLASRTVSECAYKNLRFLDCASWGLTQLKSGYFSSEKPPTWCACSLVFSSLTAWILVSGFMSSLHQFGPHSIHLLAVKKALFIAYFPIHSWPWVLQVSQSLWNHWGIFGVSYFLSSSWMRV